VRPDPPVAAAHGPSAGRPQIGRPARASAATSTGCAPACDASAPASTSFR
jgi:hypothetical protein